MEKIIKQCVGVDCAKDELASAFGVMDVDFDSRMVSNKTFRNDKSGFLALLSWSKKLRQKDVKIIFVIEATGVYHESFSLFLHQHGETVSVILPNKIKHFAGTQKLKTVNDKVSAQTIAQFGLEKKLEAWEPPHEVYNQLKQLTREKEQLNEELTQIKNQLHAERSGAWPNKKSIQRMKQRIVLIEKQQMTIKKEISEIVNADASLKERVSNICTIKGVGLITAVTVISETNGFNLIRSKKQLVSYAGLDVQEKDSGISVHHKPRISRKGNKYLRKAVYFPALSAIRSEEKMKAMFVRLVSKHGIKMKAAVAVQRKLLELIYVLWKKNEPFNPNYKQNKKLEQPQETALNEMA